MAEHTDFPRLDPDNAFTITDEPEETNVQRSWIMPKGDLAFVERSMAITKDISAESKQLAPLSRLREVVIDGKELLLDSFMNRSSLCRRCSHAEQGGDGRESLHEL